MHDLGTIGDSRLRAYQQNEVFLNRERDGVD
jgi:hypothetical protein